MILSSKVYSLGSGRLAALGGHGRSRLLHIDGMALTLAHVDKPGLSIFEEVAGASFGKAR